MAHRVFLVGFMGCGKSKFGRRLAIQAEMDFLDTDSEITRRAGMSISEIFARKGEAEFREMEAKILSELPRIERDTIVALGGGAVCREGVMDMLNAAGQAIYLKCSPEKLVARMSEKGRAKRPKIAGMNDAELMAYIEKTLPGREKYYKEAKVVLDCDKIADEAIVGALLKLIKAK